MLRRYADATSCFSNILLFLSRAKQQTRAAQWEQHAKVRLRKSKSKSFFCSFFFFSFQKQDQMLALLALSWCMSASRPLDGLVDELLRSKHSDHLARLRKV